MTQPEDAFAALPATPQHHFRIYYFAAVARVLACCAPDDEVLANLPFLIGYRNELALFDAADQDERWWSRAISAWERRAPGHLPLRALREAAALDHRMLTVLFSVGLLEEDARFGLLFEASHGAPGARRPTLGLLQACWDVEGGEARATLRRLHEARLVRVANPDAPRIEHAFEVQSVLWDAMRGELSRQPLPWLRHRPAEELLEISRLILGEELHATVDRLPELLRSRDIHTLVVRGPRHGGRRTVIGSVARALGRGLLEVEMPSPYGDDQPRIAGALATLLHAVPVLITDPAPGEKVELPVMGACDAPLAVVLGRHGGISRGLDRAISISLELPGPADRRLHWLREPRIADGELDRIAERFRLTCGHIHATAKLARSYALLERREHVIAEDVRRAVSSLDRQALDALATRVEAVGDWSELAVAVDIQRELLDLERRCRQRERLSSAVGATLARQLRSGVRALFRGPSGTGKTLAARLLAGTLGMELYKVDLASVVNKYIGETEKNLGRIFSLAEELDVMLLFDEGDALLAKRTAVQTSTDRYANLETDYLLQRIESFDGIMVLTTNAGDQIDSAFARRMDVTVDFRAPDAADRWQIWQLHLPPDHTVDPQLLREVAARCSLSGGQIRNAVLHAATLALDEDVPLGSSHVDAAVQREYRKAGDPCPLRPSAALRSVR